MMHGDRSRGTPPYHPGWGGLARKLVLNEGKTPYFGNGLKYFAQRTESFLTPCESSPNSNGKADSTWLRSGLLAPPVARASIRCLSVLDALGTQILTSRRE